MNVNELKHNVTVIPGPNQRGMMVRDDSRLTVAWTPDAARQRQDVLEIASMIETVANPAEQADAVAAQIALKTLLKACEDTRKDCKEPVLDFGRKIDAQAREFCRPLEAELERISAKVRDYVAVEETRRRAAEALRLEELSRLDRKRQEELAQARTVEQVDEIQQRINDEAKAASVPLVPVRAEGQIVREDWDITITDIGALWKAHPNCVSMEPRILEIKQLLNAGVRPAGVQARRVINSTVRTGRRADAEDWGPRLKTLQECKNENET